MSWRLGDISSQGRCLGLVFFVFALTALVVGGSRLVFVTFYLGQTSAALQTSIGYVYLVVPLSGLFIMFYAVCAMIDAPSFESPPSADDSPDSSGRPGERTASSGDRPAPDKP